MDPTTARDALAHMKNHGMAFCFLNSTGQMITIGMCHDALGINKEHTI